jgi:hypothetical protein
MRSVEARALYTLRRQFSEPVFGILKAQMNGRRFLSRGLANVRAEFSLMATAFNLRSLRRLLPTARTRAASTPAAITANSMAQHSRCLPLVSILFQFCTAIGRQVLLRQARESNSTRNNTREVARMAFARGNTRTRDQGLKASTLLTPWHTRQRQ